jgi:hypothetical protein
LKHLLIEALRVAVGTSVDGSFLESNRRCSNFGKGRFGARHLSGVVQADRLPF